MATPNTVHLGSSFHLLEESEARHPVVVNADAAAGLVTFVLLDGRSRPASEGFEVAEGLQVVVMGVPQGQALVLGVGPVKADDVLPVVVAGVDACLGSEPLTLRDHVNDEVPVGGLAGRPVVGLDVVPVHVRLCVVRFEVVHGVVDLASAVTTAHAREDVGAHMTDAGSLGSLDGVCCVRIWGAIGAVSAHACPLDRALAAWRHEALPL